MARGAVVRPSDKTLPPTEVMSITLELDALQKRALRDQVLAIPTSLGISAEHRALQREAATQLMAQMKA